MAIAYVVYDPETQTITTPSVFFDRGEAEDFADTVPDLLVLTLNVPGPIEPEYPEEEDG